MSDGDDWRLGQMTTGMAWAHYEHEQRQVARRPTHRVVFTGGPKDREVHYLPSMPPPEPALPPVGVEVGFDAHHWDNPRPPDAGPDWVSPTYRRQGLYRREGLDYDHVVGETWRYAWEAGQR